MKSFSAMNRPLAKSAGLLALVLGMSSLAHAGRHLTVPEIDAGSMASAMTLLSGGVLILMGRRRK